MLTKWLFLLTFGTLSVWLFDEWVWGNVFSYNHGHGKRYATLCITATSGLFAGFALVAVVRWVRRSQL